MPKGHKPRFEKSFRPRLARVTTTQRKSGGPRVASIAPSLPSPVKERQFDDAGIARRGRAFEGSLASRREGTHHAAHRRAGVSASSTSGWEPCVGGLSRAASGGSRR